MDKLCFVIQRPGGGRYGQLYEKVFAPAIKAANLAPYRVDGNPAGSIPIETIMEQIADSSACIAELSEDNPNVWFELGFAIAKDKPLCLVCSSVRERFPFDVQHRQIIRYPQNPLPSAFAKLQQQITERLRVVVSEHEFLRQNAEVTESLSIMPECGGLLPHEMLALTIILRYQCQNGVSVWTLINEMETGGYTRPATSVAIARLKDREFIEFHQLSDQNGELGERLFITDFGERWLLENQHKLNLRTPSPNWDEAIPF